MIANLIASLSLIVMFTGQPQVDCGADYAIGCYKYPSNEIYIGYEAPDMNRVLYHELGHAIFLNDPYSRVIIDDYKPLWVFCYNGKNTQATADEKIAVYFNLFMQNKNSFSVNYPVLYIYFNNKITKLGYYEKN